MDMILIIRDTLEIIIKPVNATSQSVIIAAHKTGLLTIYAMKEQEEKIT